MTHPSSTRIALTTAAALAAVGIASLVLTFIRADADTAAAPTDPAATTSVAPTTTTTAVPTTLATVEITTASTQPPTTPPNDEATAPPSDCHAAPYLVVRFPDGAPDTSVVPRSNGANDIDRGYDCVAFSDVTTLNGAVVTVTGAFLDEETACAAATAVRWLGGPRTVLLTSQPALSPAVAEAGKDDADVVDEAATSVANDAPEASDPGHSFDLGDATGSSDPTSPSTPGTTTQLSAGRDVLNPPVLQTIDCPEAEEN